MALWRVSMRSCSNALLYMDERERIHKRASEVRKAAKKAGTKFGRKPKLNDTQRARARHLRGLEASRHR